MLYQIQVYFLDQSSRIGHAVYDPILRDAHKKQRHQDFLKMRKSFLQDLLINGFITRLATGDNFSEFTDGFDDLKISSDVFLFPHHSFSQLSMDFKFSVNFSYKVSMHEHDAQTAIRTKINNALLTTDFELDTLTVQDSHSHIGPRRSRDSVFPSQSHYRLENSHVHQGIQSSGQNPLSSIADVQIPFPQHTTPSDDPFSFGSGFGVQQQHDLISGDRTISGHFTIQMSGFKRVHLKPVKSFTDVVFSKEVDFSKLASFVNQYMQSRGCVYQQCFTWDQQGDAFGVRWNVVIDESDKPIQYHREGIIDDMRQFISKMETGEYGFRNISDKNCYSIMPGPKESPKEWIQVEITPISLSRAPIVAIDSPLARTSHFHLQLLEKIKKAINGKDKLFEPFLKSFEARNYSQGLRRLCTATKQSSEILDVIKLLLEYKEKLNIHVNERAGKENRAAIHYAAINGNAQIYQLLVSANADIQLVDGSKKTAEFYFAQHGQFSQEQDSLHV